MELPNNYETALACPGCGPTVKLIVKTNRLNRTQFLGCPEWPECQHTQPIPESVQMAYIGAPTLPGFGQMEE